MEGLITRLRCVQLEKRTWQGEMRKSIRSLVKAGSCPELACSRLQSETRTWMEIERAMTNEECVFGWHGEQPG